MKLSIAVSALAVGSTTAFVSTTSSSSSRTTRPAFRRSSFVPSFPSTALSSTAAEKSTSSSAEAVGAPTNDDDVIVASIRPTDDGRSVDVKFSSSSTDDDDDSSSNDTTCWYRFHSLWLRDACQDANHVVGSGVGERVLTATPVGTCDVQDLRAVEASIGDDSATTVEVRWNGSSSTDASTFDAAFLREYADMVARPVSDDDEAAEEDPTSASSRHAEQSRSVPPEMEWLRPYTGYPDAPAPTEADLKLWSNIPHRGGEVEFPRFEHDDILSDATVNLDLLKALTETGVALIDHCPECDDASTLHNFIDRALGGLQKDPARDQPNWQITKKVGATSISYDHDKRLNGHTDSSIPPHGLPGVVLSMHYVSGKGQNTLADGFAVANDLREQDPEAFKLLCEYPYDAERDFIGSRVDSEQEHNKSLLVKRRNYVLSTDENDRISKIMYNEVFRLPLTLPYDVFPKWFAALDTFVNMIHSKEYERHVPMKEGTILLMNNWRVLHGRAGGMASYDRKLVGGTITRESFYSRARDCVKIAAGYDVPDIAF